MNDVSKPTAIRGDEHWTAKDSNVKLFLYGLPNPHKHFAVMPGISHASFQQKNYALVYYILWSFFLWSFFAQFAPLYRG